MLPPFVVFPRVFTPLECAELSAYAFEQKDPVTASIGHGTGGNQVHGMRRSTVRWLDVADTNLAKMCARFRKYLLIANARCIGADYKDFHELQFTQYASWNQGHYDWHRDDSTDPTFPNPWDRRLSLVLQLSNKDSYTGGRLELEAGLPEEQFREQGDLIVFASSVRHRVTPVTEGARHSLVTWAVGPRLPLPMVAAPEKKLQKKPSRKQR